MKYILAFILLIQVCDAQYLRGIQDTTSLPTTNLWDGRYVKVGSQFYIFERGGWYNHPVYGLYNKDSIGLSGAPAVIDSTVWAKLWLLNNKTDTNSVPGVASKEYVRTHPGTMDTSATGKYTTKEQVRTAYQTIVSNLADTSKYVKKLDSLIAGAGYARNWQISAKQNIIPNLSDTSKYVEQLDSLIAGTGYARNWQIATKQNVIANLGDTSKYIEGNDSLISGTGWARNWQIVSKQNTIANLADTSKYIEYADTTVKIASYEYVRTHPGSIDTSTSGKYTTKEQVRVSYQTIISNLSDTSKYVEGLDSLKGAGYATRTMLATDTTYRAAQMLLKVSKSDSSAMPGYITRTMMYSDTGAFTTTAQRVALYAPGTKPTSKIVAVPRGQDETVPVAGDLLKVRCKTDSVIILRPASGTSGLKFTAFGTK